MSIRREHFWFVLTAVFIVGIGFISYTSLSAPFARPAPHPKWADISEEPVVNVYMADTGSIRPMKLEAYLEGVVAAEMDPDWPLEALKAQAIVSRTFTIEELQRTGGVADHRPGADVSTNPEEFQAFSLDRVNEAVRRAVRETRGQIITHRGVPIVALFCSDSGGRTATLEEGFPDSDFGPMPYYRSVRVPWTAPETEWTARFTKEEVRRAAAEIAGRDPGALSSVAIEEKGPSGRTLTLRIGEVSVSAPKLRMALGSTRMRSTLLTRVEVSGDQVVMSGMGFGHGVGLSQHAARALASQGRTVREIIQFFFKGVRIEELYQ